MYLKCWFERAEIVAAVSVFCSRQSLETSYAKAVNDLRITIDRKKKSCCTVLLTGLKDMNVFFFFFLHAFSSALNLI